MQVNVYNRLGVNVTINELSIQPMHNYIPMELWAKYSANENIKLLVDNGSLLVNCYEDFQAFKNSLNDLLAIAGEDLAKLDKTALENCKTRAKSNKIVCDMLKDTFSNLQEAKEYEKINVENLLNDIDKAIKKAK